MTPVTSRVADHCFWFGRYFERCESTTRLLATTMDLALDGDLTPIDVWPSALAVSGERANFAARFGAESEADGERVQAYLVWDRASQASVVSSVHAARENARSIRDVLSGEAWRIVNELYLWLGETKARHEYDADRQHLFYPRIRDSVDLGTARLRSTMLHDAPLAFIRVGGLLERAGQTARLLDVHHHALGRFNGTRSRIESRLWHSLLKTCSGVEPFMRTHHSINSYHEVATFLVLESRFSRSIAHCLTGARDALATIEYPTGSGELDVKHELDALIAEVDEAARAIGEGVLHGLLTRVIEQSASTCETLVSALRSRERDFVDASSPSVS